MRANDAMLGLLSRQNGLITAAQAAEHGLTERTLRRRVHDGGWARVAPGVVLAGGHPWTDRARVRAAGLWAGGRGVVSGPAAAWWQGMSAGVPARVELTVPRTCGLRSRRGVRVRRRDLDPHDVVHVDGIALTAPALTALETAAAVPDGSAFLDRALQKHVRFPAVYRAYCRNLGQEGSALMAKLLTAAADRADSAAERVLIGILRSAGVTGWRQGVPFGPWEIDLAFPDVKLAVEVDGWAWHVDVDRFRADRHKGNALTRAGWTVLRFTWHDLTNRPAYVLAEIRAALRVAA
jgi:very-short-patch-repair endonuclease